MKTKSKIDMTEFAHYNFWVPNSTADQLSWITGYTKSNNNIIALVYIVDFVFNILKQQEEYAKGVVATSGGVNVAAGGSERRLREYAVKACSKDDLNENT